VWDLACQNLGLFWGRRRASARTYERGWAKQARVHIDWLNNPAYLSPSRSGDGCWLKKKKWRVREMGYRPRRSKPKLDEKMIPVVCRNLDVQVNC